MSKSQTYRRAFTLVELLVVVSIVGLLAVAVLPALSNGGDRRLLRGAAERVDTHFKRAAADATGRARGAAVWVAPDVASNVVLDLEYARVPTGTPGITSVSPAGNVAGVDPALGVSAGAIRFPMVPVEFFITNSSQIALNPPFPPLPPHSLGRTVNNTAFPTGSTNYIAYPPPDGPRVTSRPTVLPERSCVDLQSSTIGVNGFGAFSGGGATPLSSYSEIAVCFDVNGKAIEVWGDPNATAVRHVLDGGTPLALLVTLAGSATGTGWQNPDAVWVVIDPKTGRNLLVPNKFQPTDLADAQSFIVDDLTP